MKATLVLIFTATPALAFAQINTTCAPGLGTTVNCTTINSGIRPAPRIDWGAAQTPDFVGDALRARAAGDQARASQAQAQAVQAQAQAQAQTQMEAENRAGYEALRRRDRERMAETFNLNLAAFVRDGKCAEAKDYALSAGNMDAAEQAMRLCVPKSQ